MLPGNVLFVVTLRADLTISGLAYRLMAGWRYLYENEEQNTVFLITTRSLWNKMYGDEIPDAGCIHIIDDSENYKLKALLLSATVIKNILTNKIKIMHTNGNFMLLPVHYLKSVLGIKTVVTFGSATLEMASGYSKYAKKQWESILNAASAIDVLNPVNTVSGYRSLKYISACSFPFNLKKLDDFASRTMAKDEVVTFIGSFTPQKNPLLAVAGFEKYIELSGNNELRLEMFGKGSEKEEIQMRARDINTKFRREAVFIHDNDYLLYEILSKSRIFLSLQDYTNYPSQSLMEAMILGNSVIATDFGDTDRMVLPRNSNVLIGEKDSDLMAGALATLLQVEGTNSKNADFIRNNHNIGIFTQYLKKLYTEVIGTK